MKLTTRPLTPDLWPAFEDLFGENGAVGGCWCMYWRIGRAYRKKPRENSAGLFCKSAKRLRSSSRSNRSHRVTTCGLKSLNSFSVSLYQLPRSQLLERVSLTPESRPTASSIHHLFSANCRHRRTSPDQPSRTLAIIEPE